MQEGAIVLKRDVRGRVRVPAEQRAVVVAEFKRSGLSGAQFARVAGMKYQTLMAWIAKQRGRPPDRQRKAQSPLFVQAVAARPPTKVVIDLGNGMAVGIESGDQIALAAQLIAALKGSC